MSSAENCELASFCTALSWGILFLFVVSFWEMDTKTMSVLPETHSGNPYIPKKVIPIFRQVVFSYKTTILSRGKIAVSFEGRISLTSPVDRSPLLMPKRRESCEKSPGFWLRELPNKYIRCSDISILYVYMDI